MSEFYNNKLKNLNKHNLNKYVSAVQYSEWTTLRAIAATSVVGGGCIDGIMTLSIRILLPLIIIAGCIQSVEDNYVFKSILFTRLTSS